MYVLGFGYDVSEFDLWWLLDRKHREKAETGKIYFYSPEPSTFDEKRELLKVFGKVEMISCGIKLPSHPGNRTSKEDELNYNTERKAAYSNFYALALNDIKCRIVEKHKEADHG